jgi:hypothetical protein
MEKIHLLAASALVGVFMVFTYAGYGLAGGETMAKGETCPLDWSASGPAQFSGYIGALVLDRDKQELGRVVHVTHDSREAINFLIIYSCLGDMRDQLVAFPVNLSNPKQRVDTVVLDTTQQEFRGAPVVESRMYPTRVRSSWADESYHYFENTLNP